MKVNEIIVNKLKPLIKININNKQNLENKN